MFLTTQQEGKNLMAVINAPVNDFSDIEHAVMPFNILADHYGAQLAATQLQLEHEAHTEGEKRFLKVMERQIKAGEFGDNVVAKPLLSTLAPKFTERMITWRDECNAKRGANPVAMTLTEGLLPEAAAFITMKVVLACLTREDASNLQNVASKIGRSVEDELRFGRIRDQEAEHYKKRVKKALNKRVGQVYKKAFMQAVESKMLEANQLDSKWSLWTPEENIHVGVRMLELLIESTGLVELTRPYAGNVEKDAEYIQLTPEYVDLLNKRAGALAAISPMYQPCVVPPKPWVTPVGGGYWAAGRKPLTLVRTGSKKGLERYSDVYMPEVYSAVNIAQDTAWKINKKVLAVVNEIVNWKNCPVSDVPSSEKGELPQRPDDMDTNEIALKAWKKEAAGVYRMEKSRVSRRMSMEFTIAQANKFSQFKTIWFPYNMDWRGRVYAIPMFNPQGNDMTKGLLTLAQGKPIGLDGLYWLKIHGANTAGVDKVPFPERIKFIEDNHEHILASAADPLGYTWWAEQDSPFCFLAFCFEYAGVEHHGLNYNCSLPLAFDGSCSGIQHFSAMLRDEVGGKAVNLLPSETVQDIYNIVAERVKEMLRTDAINGEANNVETIVDKTTGEITERFKLGTKELAEQWLAFGVNRSVTKRSVMTLAYGSKEYGFRDQVLEDTIKPAIDNGKGLMFTQPNQAAGYMAKLIWEAVSVTVVAAVEAMNWLKSAAKLLAAEVKDKKTKAVLRKRCAVHWTTPDGFPVWQEYKKPVQTRLNLMFLGQIRLQPTVNTNRDNGIDARKQESGIAPNFVHSMDGSHLRQTVNKAHSYGVKSFALIHDSFGTIPADAGLLFKAVRETLVDTYEDNDVLADFYEQFADQLHESQLDKMPAMPAKGNLDLQEILKSDFAFA
ncbi:RNA polymerase [Yersinia phage fPS-50]|uniref:DNA-directed RNA polymerase n=2 Tax=Helsettvirus fPS9 TaxID=2733625 RepID=A0A2D0PDY6_9CAUD|nr:RNA polymerase [Yersinia phage fPS-52]SOO46689.1 RNA polymerase [Yersinia phage fPS-50]